MQPVQRIIHHWGPQFSSKHLGLFWSRLPWVKEPALNQGSCLWRFLRMPSRLSRNSSTSSKEGLCSLCVGDTLILRKSSYCWETFKEELGKDSQRWMHFEWPLFATTTHGTKYVKLVQIWGSTMKQHYSYINMSTTMTRQEHWKKACWTNHLQSMSDSICTPLETLATLNSKATFFQLKMLDYGPQKMRRSMWSWAHGLRRCKGH